MVFQVTGRPHRHLQVRHLQQVTQDFIQHVDALAQKHKIPLITAKPGESQVDQAAPYLDTVANRVAAVRRAACSLKEFRFWLSTDS